MRELHGERVLMFLGEIGTQHVESREHPAATRRFLVVNRLFRRFHAEIRVNRLLVLEIHRQCVDAVLRHRIEQCLVSRLLRLFHFLQHLRRNATAFCLILCVGHARQCEAEAHEEHFLFHGFVEFLVCNRFLVGKITKK